MCILILINAMAKSAIYGFIGPLCPYIDYSKSQEALLA